MEISYNQNPDTFVGNFHDLFVTKTATEQEARHIFSTLIGPGCSFSVGAGEDKTGLKLDQYWEDEWEVSLQYLSEKIVRMGTVTRLQADRLIEAVFRQEDLVSVTDAQGVCWTDIPEEVPDEWLFLHPGISHIEEDGKIIMKAGGSGKNGIWDGSFSFKTSEPDYDFWHWLVTSEKWSSSRHVFTHDLISRLKKEFERGNV